MLECTAGTRPSTSTVYRGLQRSVVQFSKRAAHCIPNPAVTRLLRSTRSRSERSNYYPAAGCRLVRTSMIARTAHTPCANGKTTHGMAAAASHPAQQFPDSCECSCVNAWDCENTRRNISLISRVEKKVSVAVCVVSPASQGLLRAALCAQCKCVRALHAVLQNAGPLQSWGCLGYGVLVCKSVCPIGNRVEHMYAVSSPA